VGKVVEKERAAENLPKGWQWHTLESLSPIGISNGAFKRRHEFGSGAPFINVYDLYQGLAVDISKVERAEASEKEIKQYGVAPGDLLFCRSSLKREGIGWCAYVCDLPEPTIFDCHLMRVRPDFDVVVPEFIAYYWQHPEVRASVVASSRTATMTTMNQKDLGSILIPLPPRPEQKRIVEILSDRLSAVEKARAATEAQLAAINALPAAYLRQAFNGEL
jgi:type I restriction enzyme, S subunit